MSVAFDRESPIPPPTDIRRVPQAAVPTDRVSLDWWQTPSVAANGVQLVAGEARHQREIAAVAESWPARNVVAQLMSDPANPHDRHAVMVLLDGYKIGHLPDDRDPRFTAIVNHLALTQGPVRARARITGGAGLPWGVTLYADPEPFDRRLDFCSGPLHEPVVATAEPQLLTDALTHRSVVAVQLSVAAGLLRVSVDGLDVGHLRRSVGEPYLPLVNAAVARGIAATCRGVVRHVPRSVPRVSVAVLRHPRDLADVCN